MRKAIIAGNWKMNIGPEGAKVLISELAPLVADAQCDVVVCPPFVDLASAVAAAKGTNIKVGSQNIHWAEKGAYTGEISAAMLNEIGVEYAIIGHSERRQYFGETDESVNMRVKAAIAAGITPIMCVGESLEERESGKTDDKVSAQVKDGLSGVEASDVARMVIAYEPIWAIGTGKTATKEQANETVGVIRETVKKLFGADAASSVRIQYGGSMNPKNASELMAMPEIDGGLIGGASLKAEDFSKVVKY